MPAPATAMNPSVAGMSGTSLRASRQAFKTVSAVPRSRARVVVRAQQGPSPMHMRVMSALAAAQLAVLPLAGPAVAANFIEEIKDQITNPAARDAANKALDNAPTITEVGKNLGKEFSQDSATAVGDNVKAAAKDAASKAPSAGDLKGAAADLKNKVSLDNPFDRNPAEKAADAAKGAVGDLKGQVGGASGSLKEAAGGVSGDAKNALGGVSGDAKGALGDLKGAAADLKNKVSLDNPFDRNPAEKAADAAKGAVGDLKGQVGGASGSLKEAAGGVSGDAKNALGGVSGDAKGALGDLKGAAADLKNKVSLDNPFDRNPAEKAADAAKGAVGDLKGQVGGASGSLKDAAGGVSGDAKNALGGVSGDAKGALGDLKGAAADLKNKVSLDNPFDGRNPAEKAADAAKGAVGDLKGQVGGASGSLKDVAGGLSGDAKSALGGVSGDAKGALGDLKGAAADLKSKVSLDLPFGDSNAADKAADAAKGAADKAKDVAGKIDSATPDLSDLKLKLPDTNVVTDKAQGAFPGFPDTESVATKPV